MLGIDRVHGNGSYTPGFEVANSTNSAALIVLKNFLDDQRCARIRAEVSAASVTPATVFQKGESYLVKTDENARKTKWGSVSDATRTEIQESLLAVKPHLEKYFSLKLTGSERLQFLLYNEGDFFRPHYDGVPDPPPSDDFAYLHARKLSVVIFLNDQTDEFGPETFSGGALRFYKPAATGRLLLGQSSLAVTVQPTLMHELKGETGTLVAFRPNLLHEVEVVRGGGRHTIASWFY